MIRGEFTRGGLFAGVLLLLLVAPLQAQQATKRSARDGVYTAAQADRGQAAFRETCEVCHAPRYFTGGFLRNWSSVGELFDFTVGNMPEDAPGSLSAQRYADVLAYVLKLNNLPPGDQELPAELAPLQAITFPPAP
jgi:mono/diheme cytochrome c family protein